MKNCKRCTRWRPLSDYEPVVYNPTPYTYKEYLRHVCNVCIKAAKKQKEQNFGKIWRKQARDREAARRARRKRGIPARHVGPKNKGAYAGQNAHDDERYIHE